MKWRQHRVRDAIFVSVPLMDGVSDRNEETVYDVTRPFQTMQAAVHKNRPLRVWRLYTPPTNACYQIAVGIGLTSLPRRTLCVAGVDKMQLGRANERKQEAVASREVRTAISWLMYASVTDSGSGYPATAWRRRDQWRCIDNWYTGRQFTMSDRFRVVLLAFQCNALQVCVFENVGAPSWFSRELEKVLYVSI